MCGIVGYAGPKNVGDVLIRGLERLEYRGYDSAGVAIRSDDEIYVQKKKGRISDLFQGDLPTESLGIGHTRWATHGKPADKNAHPFLDCQENISIVHNGIIDNFNSIRDELTEKGHEFSSETDSEIIAHLIEENYDGDFLKSFKKTIRELEGSYAVVAIHKGSDELVVARNQSPLVIGIGSGENLVASDAPALLDYTKNIKYLQDGDIARITNQEVEIWDEDNTLVERETKRLNWDVEDAEKGGYEHFMLKEIFEQPKAIHDSLLGRLNNFEDVDFSKYDVDSVQFIACGTSAHAGYVGRYIFEKIAKVPCTVEVSSEYRYTSSSESSPFTIFFSQSGETLDTVAAAREANRRGCDTLAVTNVLDSSITREVDEVIYTQAGPEIGVAATKTFTTQVIILYLLAIELGLARGVLSKDEAENYKDELRTLPRKVERILDDKERIKKKTKRLAEAEDIFFVGRNINYPVALEGALKLKEIAYIHAAGYPAGELKHGPFALLTEETPVIALAVRDQTFEKMLGNIGEIAARDSPVFVVGDENKELKKLADERYFIPKVPPLFSPILMNVVLQLTAYYTAYRLDRDIDKPRNLAKSVTVE
ncbi:MAG: glutamine--fructose-6-phosphate transaminase (isomerizing) [Candidatus Thermoplasmatota archaeon]|nr:glutamine--fructose-6-phosphate transaminase (isomerizing) [Candidatus Thermoplasmatota archaeon]